MTLGPLDEMPKGVNYRVKDVYIAPVITFVRPEKGVMDVARQLPWLNQDDSTDKVVSISVPELLHEDASDNVAESDMLSFRKLVQMVKDGVGQREDILEAKLVVW